MDGWISDFTGDGEIRLSRYAALNESEWHDRNEQFLIALSKLLGQKTGVNFLATEQAPDNLFAAIRGELLKKYQAPLYSALYELGSSGEAFEREFIFGSMLSAVRRLPNANELANLMKNTGILDGFSFLGNEFNFDTRRYSLVRFTPASLKYPKAAEIFAARDLSDGCHKYTERFLKLYPETEAVTCTQNKLINLRYYHSFILDGENAVDVANNVMMERSWYYYLTGVAELNRVNYEEFLNTKNESAGYDESGTLYPLLRMAIWNEIRHKRVQKTAEIM